MPKIAVITSPLNGPVGNRIVREAPPEISVIYRPDLLPTPRYSCDHDGDPGWSRTPEQEREFRKILRDAEITWGFPAIGDDGPAALTPNLRWVQGTSAGVGAKVRALGLHDDESVWITTASGIHARPLAEYIFGALISRMKQADTLMARQHAHEWIRFTPDTLSGKTMAIVGPGRIGREVARVAHVFGMHVIALASDSRPQRAPDLGVDVLYTRDRFHEMLARADVIVLSSPLTPETENIMDAAAFAHVRSGSTFVNIGRGALVDEDALLAAIRDGRVGFAVLDVFRTEPLPPDSPFWDEPNVRISPHSMANAADEHDRIADVFIANMAHYAAGHPERMAPQYRRDRGY